MSKQVLAAEAPTRTIPAEIQQAIQVLMEAGETLHGDINFGVLAQRCSAAAYLLSIAAASTVSNAERNAIRHAALKEAHAICLEGVRWSPTPTKKEQFYINGTCHRLAADISLLAADGAATPIEGRPSETCRPITSATPDRESTEYATAIEQICATTGWHRNKAALLDSDGIFRARTDDAIAIWIAAAPPSTEDQA